MRQEAGNVGEDQELIAAARAGDSAACERLHALHAARTRAYFRRCGFSQADADDLVQETFLRVYRALAEFDPAKGGFPAWLGTIARNLARKRWAQRPLAQTFDAALAEDMFVAADAPGDTPEAREEAQAVRDCVARLPGELARLVRLRYVDGRTTRGVAEAAGLPEATVRARLQEARALLAKCLKGKGVLE